MTPRFPDAARLAGRSLLRWQTDERLASLAGAGSERAFEAIVERYRTQLLRHCGRLLPASRAEDAVQQAFMNAYRALARGDVPRDLRPWLYRIAHNSALNALREGGWDHATLDQSPAVADLVEDVVERRENLSTVLSAVDELPGRQRDAVLLRVLEGRSYEDIAVALGVSSGAVRQLLHRSRTALRAAATAVTPAPLLDRLLAGSPPAPSANATRIAELAAGTTAAAGTGSLAKLGAVVLATGAVAGAAIELDGSGRDPAAGREPPATAPVSPGDGEPPAALASNAAGPSGDSNRGSSEGHGGGGSSGPSGKSGPSGSSGPSSSSGPSASSASGSSGGSGSSGSDSSGSGSSGGDSSGSGSSGSGSSGSGSSGSGSSGSGSSGSGSGADTSGTSGGSGSSDSGGSSGSGDSGPG